MSADEAFQVSFPARQEQDCPGANCEAPLLQVLVVLDNYISRGTDVFLTCKQPDYLASVNQVHTFPQ